MKANMSLEENIIEVSDEEIVKCFGKHKHCTKNCRLKSLCNSEAKEREEEAFIQKYRETEFIDNMDTTGNHVAPEFCFDYTQEHGDFLQEILDAIEQLDVSDHCRRELLNIYRSKLAAESSEEAVKELLQRMGEIYVNDSTGFEVMFFQILAGGNQAALARQRQCSKQNINKIIARGKKRLAAYQAMIAEKPGCRLTCRELAVYHAIELCGLTYRETASILGCTVGTIWQIKQKMSLKGVKLNKKHPGRRKGNKRKIIKVRNIYG